MIVQANIQGLTKLLEAERTVGAKTEGFLTTELLGVGRDVARETSRRYQPYSAAGAAGIQTKVFTSGLWVLQTIKKSRNPARRRPNFGPLMYRKAFYPAVKQNESKTLIAAERAVERARLHYWEA